jgi:hypothetical protein
MKRKIKFTEKSKTKMKSKKMLTKYESNDEIEKKLKFDKRAKNLN